MTALPTPSQTVGPFFSIGLCPNAPCHLVPAGLPPEARVVTVEGRVLDGDGVPVPDAVLEIWRADEHGEFAGPDAPAGRNDQGVPAGFARIPVDELGRFEFTTVKPGARREAGGAVHAPHLAVLLFMRGLLAHLTTRVYFAGEPANDQDPVLQLVPAGRRATLLARPAGAADRLRWEVRLQGEGETVFFAT